MLQLKVNPGLTLTAFRTDPAQVNVTRYIEVDFTFGLPDYVRYIEEFVISRFYSIHFTVTLVGTENLVRYIEDFVK